MLRQTEPMPDEPDPPPVTYEVADGVATITLARPGAMNSLTREVKEALLETVRRAARDEAVRCVVLTGSGRAFCVGQDLKEHVDDLAGKPLAEVWSTVDQHYNPLVTELATMAKPVVGAVNGIAAGAGASLAFACDLRLVAESAGFNLAFAGVGLSCDTGSSWTLPRLIGHAKAVELLLQPRTVRAEEALALGLATRVVADDQLAAEARALAGRLAQGPTLAYAAIRRSLGFSAGHDLADSLEVEREGMHRTGASQDHRDAAAAFVAKRQPVFRGR
jgi:2-(1,2-epoxy-1,2-dihydrophenyl)acetyl-CoA isomerase